MPRPLLGRRVAPALAACLAACGSAAAVAIAADAHVIGGSAHAVAAKKTGKKKKPGKTGASAGVTRSQVLALIKEYSGKGSQGSAGPAGPAGATGATGATGPMGATGDTGTAGNAGAAGLKGAEGAQGPEGAQGAPGNPASIPTLPAITPFETSSFISGWSNHGTIQPPGYYKDALGIVHLTGTVKASEAGKVPGYILDKVPAGYQIDGFFPAGSSTSTTPGTSSACTLSFFGSAGIYANGGCNYQEISLEGITYRPTG